VYEEELLEKLNAKKQREGVDAGTQVYKLPEEVI